MIRKLLVPAVAACTALGVLSGLGPHGAQAAPTTAEPATSPLVLRAPAQVQGYSYRNRIEFDAGLRLLAPEEPFEIWSRRPSYSEPIRTEWRSPSATVTLPDGIQSNFRGLPGFVKFVFRTSDGTVVKRRRMTVCLNGGGQRAHPDAPLRSPYPRGCPRNRFTLGSVQGIQGGWSTRLELYPRVKLPTGEYAVTAVIPRKWRKPFGIAVADARRQFTLVAQDYDEEHYHRSRSRSHETQEPAASRPRSAAAGEPAGVLPDLRALPAFGLRISRGGNHLQFAATVWNAGDSPLVVDGFRRPDEDVMDAYQYFVDSDGNQTGYQKVGTMEWDAKDTHNHWHFRDFARYRLLDADKTSVFRSRKEAFCLVNTDAVDYTVPGADWQPDETDLHSACGERDSESIREVLSSGSGDTYMQFRAGQSFSLKGLPNGIYHVSVEANPAHRLVEHSTDNNVRLRKVRIGGVPGARTVKGSWFKLP